MLVLGIEVPPELRARWPGWFAPDVQPFLVADATVGGAAQPDRPLSPELRDTFQLYEVPDGLSRVWLSLDAPLRWAGERRVNVVDAL